MLAQNRCKVTLYCTGGIPSRSPGRKWHGFRADHHLLRCGMLGCYFGFCHFVQTFCLCVNVRRRLVSCLVHMLLEPLPLQKRFEPSTLHHACLLEHWLLEISLLQQWHVEISMAAANGSTQAEPQSPMLSGGLLSLGLKVLPHPVQQIILHLDLLALLGKLWCQMEAT